MKPYLLIAGDNYYPSANDFIRNKPMKPLKLFQYDKKVWDDGDTDYTWQFGIFNNRSLLWVYYEYPTRLVHSNGGLHILLSFFTSSHLLGADFQVGKVGFSFNLFAEYFDGWNEEE